MMNFPSIGVLPTGSVPIGSTILVIDAPAMIALGFTVALLVAASVARLRRRRRPATRPRSVRARLVTLACAASEGGRR